MWLLNRPSKKNIVRCAENNIQTARVVARRVGGDDATVPSKSIPRNRCDSAGSNKRAAGMATQSRRPPARFRWPAASQPRGAKRPVRYCGRPVSPAGPSRGEPGARVVPAAALRTGGTDRRGGLAHALAAVVASTAGTRVRQWAGRRAAASAAAARAAIRARRGRPVAALRQPCCTSTDAGCARQRPLRRPQPRSERRAPRVHRRRNRSRCWCRRWCRPVTCVHARVKYLRYNTVIALLVAGGQHKQFAKAISQ